MNITNNTAQTAKTGEDAVTTVANLNRDVQTSLQTTPNGEQIATAVDSSGNNLAGTLTPIFDQAQIQRELQAQVQITQAFSQVAPKAVGDYAGNKVKDLIAQAQLASQNGNEVLGNQLVDEAKKWDDGGVYRIALHSALGGLLTGDLTGALGAGAVAGAAPLLNDLQSKVSEALTNAGANNQTASTISQALAQLTSIGIGAAIGGSAGAGTALVVDTNNRQLHESEKQRAKSFAQNSGGKYTQKQIEDAMRLLGNTDLNENIATGMVVDAKNSNDPNYVYDKDTPFTISADGQQFYQQLPSVPNEIIQYVIAQSGGITSPYMPPVFILPPETAASGAPRDRMTNLPLDNKGRYSVSAVIDGKAYTAKYYQCASVECIASGANIDSKDLGTQAYQNAMFKKGMGDIGKGAAVVTLVNPLGVVGAVAGVVGTGTSFLGASADNGTVDAIVATASSAGTENYLKYAWKLPEAAAKRVTAIIELLGGWDAYAKLLNPANNPNKAAEKAK